jgi:hypothetical protein
VPLVNVGWCWNPTVRTGAAVQVVAELRERVGICVWVGLHVGPAMSEDKAPACNVRHGSEW